MHNFVCAGDCMEVTPIILLITMTKTIKLLLARRRVVEIGCKLGGDGGLGRWGLRGDFTKLISLELLRTHSLASLYSYPLQPLEQACLWHRIKICLRKALNPRQLAYPHCSRTKCTQGEKKKATFHNVINNS
jgi:hypothetical protein